MRYSYEFKRKCVEIYRSGIYPETPEGISKKSFHGLVQRWRRLEDKFGPDALKHRKINREWSAEEKLELIMQVDAGKSVLAVAVENHISDSMLHQWVRKYREFGYNGLVNRKKGRRSRKTDMRSKTIEPRPLNESEREELIRLRKEKAEIRAEIEAVKKRIALRHERWAAQLKAKRQQSSGNSGNRDTD